MAPSITAVVYHLAISDADILSKGAPRNTTILSEAIQNVLSKGSKSIQVGESQIANGNCKVGTFFCTGETGSSENFYYCGENGFRQSFKCQYGTMCVKYNGSISCDKVEDITDVTNKNGANKGGRAGQFDPSDSGISNYCKSINGSNGNYCPNGDGNKDYYYSCYNKRTRKTMCPNGSYCLSGRKTVYCGYKVDDPGN
ncbi:hypothetical protein AYI70_g431 [Smittium culicis]|uniref:Uncharacterized protein n=1 Tax=Smittium culicis TaxID=133412 RepID=A0A1R1YGR0_9FUNG|nr:hypothetical protein AYI70_g431 [Smittium culicis]